MRLPFTGAKTRVSTFGVLTLHNTILGEVKCNVVDSGKVWNTVLAEAGKDEATASKMEEYEAALCKGVITVASGGRQTIDRRCFTMTISAILRSPPGR